jgi:hypothetical protein
MDVNRIASVMRAGKGGKALNRLLRQYFPKGMDLIDVTEE